jgi:uncharacterized protein YjbI with pentapeptide repeats
MRVGIRGCGRAVLVSGLVLAALAIASPAGARTARVKVPGKPDIESVTPLNTAVSVDFAPPSSDGGSAITSYTVKATSKGEPTGTCSVAATAQWTCVVAGLINGKKYSVAVTATNDVGTGKPAKSIKNVPSSAQNCSYIGDYANLQGCGIDNVYYPNASMIDADLLGTQMTGAQLANDNMTGDNMTSTQLGGANLAGANLTNADMTTTYLNGGNLSDATLDGVNLTDANLNDVTLYGVASGGITGTPVLLPIGWELVDGYLIGEDANLAGANLGGANLSGDDLVTSNLTLSYLENANLSHANLGSVNLTDSNMYGANLSGANLTDAVWHDTGCPDGSNSSFNSPQTCIGHLNPA